MSINLIFELEEIANCILDVLNYLDRNNIAAARLGTLEKDTGLEKTQYNTVIVGL